MSFSRLPRAIPGRPVKAEDWNALCDAIERCQIRKSDGVEVRSGPNGTTIQPIAQPTTMIALTTSVITKMVGTAPGSGNVIFQSFDGTNFSGGLTTAKVYSFLLDKGIASGAYVQLKFALGVWWVDAVDQCSDLT